MVRRRRHKKVLKLARGFYSGRRKHFRKAKEQLERSLVYAFREEMELRLLREATLTDGTNTYNLAQQDMIAFRFTMRLGIAVPNPVNRVNGTAATRYPFATITKSSE